MKTSSSCGDFKKDDSRDVDATRRAWYNGVPHWTAWLKHPRYGCTAAEDSAQRYLWLLFTPESPHKRSSPILWILRKNIDVVPWGRISHSRQGRDEGSLLERGHTRSVGPVKTLTFLCFLVFAVASRRRRSHAHSSNISTVNSIPCKGRGWTSEISPTGRVLVVSMWPPRRIEERCRGQGTCSPPTNR